MITVPDRPWKRRLVAALIAGLLTLLATLFPKLAERLKARPPLPAPLELREAAPPVAGDEPPRFFGWVNDPAAVKTICEDLGHPHFQDTDAFQSRYDGPEDVFLWDACRKVTGQLLPPRNQGQVGSCVSFGTASAIEHLLCVQAANGANEDYCDLVQEVIYGGSRVEIGGGKIRGDGSIGAWAAKFVSQYGVVPRGTHGTRNLSAYSESLCREFGRSGVPDDLEAIAKQHPVRSVALVRSWSECQAAIRNGYPIAVCSNQGFAMTRDRDGFCAPRGTWYHCMAIVGIRGGARPGALVLNSWGANAHTGPLGLGDPSPAGFWADATVVDRMLRQGDSWAFSDAVGFPARKLNWYAARPDLRFKARAALALTFAEAKRSYADAHAEAERTRQPLVVFVGQPERTVTGAITVGVDGFPDARSPSVVLGIPGDGRFRRLDLPGRPEERAIRNAMTLPSSTSLPRDCGICKLR